MAYVCIYTRDVNDLKIGVAILTTQLLASYLVQLLQLLLHSWQNFVTNIISQTDNYHNYLVVNVNLIGSLQIVANSQLYNTMQCKVAIQLASQLCTEILDTYNNVTVSVKTSLVHTSNFIKLLMAHKNLQEYHTKLNLLASNNIQQLAI